MKKKFILYTLMVLTAVYFILVIHLVSRLDLNKLGGKLILGFQDQCSCQFSNLGNNITNYIKLPLYPHKPKEEVCQVQTTAQNNKFNISMYSLLQSMHMKYSRFILTRSGWFDDWDIHYSPKQWDHDPLEVYVVLHSHNDPGWLQTPEQYFKSKTIAILNEAVYQLTANPTLKFIWAETYFLQMWWNSATETRKKQLISLLNGSQFEILTGGWVMTDEATVHYQDMLTQLTTGHIWLQNVLNYTVQHSWSIDPFGHSPTMTYLLQETGSDGLVIQRTHYAIKHHLGDRKLLEFDWKQAWAYSEKNGVRCHLMPFTLYNILHAWGPDPSVTCLVDFGRRHCWRGSKSYKPDDLTKENVEDRADKMIDQLRKKAQLYAHNVLLVPHGDDFTYTSRADWNKTISNLQLLFDYMNKRPDYKIKIKFGSVKDYFDAVTEKNDRKQDRSARDLSKTSLPSLAGDFFTYADRGQQYWSGYYTSRPFLKHMIRVLQNHLRSAELLFSLSSAVSPKTLSQEWHSAFDSHLQLLDKAYQLHGLLQHHDAITGTSRAFVMADYRYKLFLALRHLFEVLTFTVDALFTTPSLIHPKPISSFKMLEFINSGSSQSPLKMTTITVQDGSMDIFIFNPLAQHRSEVFRTRLLEPDVTVEDFQGQRVKCQINPVLSDENQISDNTLELAFYAEIPPLSVMGFRVSKSISSLNACRPAKVTIINAIHKDHKPGYFDTEWKGLHNFILENDLISTQFCSCSGLLQTVHLKQYKQVHRTEMQFVRYDTYPDYARLHDKSGAYIFLPYGSAKLVEYSSPNIVIAEGVLMSSASTVIPHVKQTVIVYNTTGLLGSQVFIENMVNIQQNSENIELAMRIRTHVENRGHFYTDLNGFQFAHRRTQSRLQIQGNYYPMTSQAWIEDKGIRVSILSSSSHGAASLHEGELEVMLDRKLKQDDWRGLNEGVYDNLPTPSQFIVLLEVKSQPNSWKVDEATIGLPSLLSHLMSSRLNSPPIGFFRDKKTSDRSAMSRVTMLKPLPCDYHLVSLRPRRTFSRQQPTALLVLHRYASDCHLTSAQIDKDQYNDELLENFDYFNRFTLENIKEAFLTGHERPKNPSIKTLRISPHQMRTFNVTLQFRWNL